MSRLANDATRHRFTPADRLLLDANVWITVMGPREPKSWAVRTYSMVFARIKAAGAKLYVDATVLGEFVRAYVGIKHRALCADDRSVPKGYKDFRRSQFFAPVAHDAAEDAKRLLSLCDKTQTPFESVNLTTLIDSFAQGRLDVGDLLIAEVCRTVVKAIAPPRPLDANGREMKVGDFLRFKSDPQYECDVWYLVRDIRGATFLDMADHGWLPCSDYVVVGHVN